jgi:hypothetical protein
VKKLGIENGNKKNPHIFLLKNGSRRPWDEGNGGEGAVDALLTGIFRAPVLRASNSIR